MQCDEKKQICLNYASNVPEWQLDITLKSLADLGAAVCAIGKVQTAVAGDLAWMKQHPDSEYLGTIPVGRVRACQEAAAFFGSAMYALENILAQSSQFGFAKDLAYMAEASYNTAHVALEDRCRKHGCPEVAYRHGKS